MLRGVLVGMLENQRGSLGADHRAHQQEDQRNSRDAPDLFRHFVCIISRRSGRQSGASSGSVTLRTNSLARHAIDANPASSRAMLPMTLQHGWQARRRPPWERYCLMLVMRETV